MSRNTVWCLSVGFLLACTRALAADYASQSDSTDLFQHGKYEIALNSGPMFSPIGATHNRPTLNYTLSELQLGWMVTEVNHSTWLRGNFELAGELMGGTVFEGVGSYMIGTTLWGRYNFVQSNWRLVPYVQAGAGILATDMDPVLVGEKFNFNLNFGVGVRYFVAPNWALSAECRYQHISNATLGEHDLGINAVGPIIGLSHFF
jgi:opacity protein-like surface antigen